jgi:hypothetical protein
MPSSTSISTVADFKEIAQTTRETNVAPMLDQNVFKLFEGLMDEKQKLDVLDIS